MNDTEYKQRFHALTIQLGRVPDTRDREWWGLTEEMRRSHETPSGVDVRKSRVRDLVPDAREEEPLPGVRGEASGVDGALGRPGMAEINPGAATEPEAGSGAGADCQTPPEPDWSLGLAPVVGARGPGGGILARCVVCSRVWERPKSRGRPAYKCEQCR